MVIVILFAVIALFFTGAYVWASSDEFMEYFFGLFLIAFTTVLASIFGLGVALCLPMDTVTKVDTYNIVSLKDNNNVSGNFLLGSGSINGEMKYTFYYEENGFYKMKQIDVNNTSIKYSNDIKVERYREEATESFINYFAIDDLENESNMSYIIYIPEGSIKNNYTLDAE